MHVATTEDAMTVTIVEAEVAPASSNPDQPAPDPGPASTEDGLRSFVGYLV